MEELESQALSVLDQAKAMSAIGTNKMYAYAGQFIVDAKRLIAKITDAHKASIDAAHLAHKAAIALRDSHIQPIHAALRIVEPLALAYKQEQDRAAREEAQRVADEQRREREAQAIKDAEALEAMGFDEAANSKLAEATAPQRITPVVSTLPKVAGLSTRKKWVYEIVDPAAVKREFCIPNEKLIHIHVDGEFYKTSKVTPEMVKALEDKIGGIKVMEVETMVGRTK